MLTQYMSPPPLPWWRPHSPVRSFRITEIEQHPGGVLVFYITYSLVPFPQWAPEVESPLSSTSTTTPGPRSRSPRPVQVSRRRLAGLAVGHPPPGRRRATASPFTSTSPAPTAAPSRGIATHRPPRLKVHAVYPVSPARRQVRRRVGPDRLWFYSEADSVMWVFLGLAGGSQRLILCVYSEARGWPLAVGRLSYCRG